MAATVAAALPHALALAGAGLPVIPIHSMRAGVCSCVRGAACDSPGKHPRVKHGLSEATCDRSTIEAWLARWPDSYLALVCGWQAGMWALDIDPRHDGPRHLERLEGEFGALPTTIEAATGGGGRHLLFRHPGGDQRIKTRGAIRTGIDVRGDGGYIVVEPSGHASGGAYRWVRSPLVTAAVDAPRWLLEMVLSPVRPAPAQGGGAPGRRGEAGAPIAEGGRNAALTSLGGTMRRRGLSQAAIEAALLAENRERCCPPLGEDEVRGIAASVSRYEPARARPDIVGAPEPEIRHGGDVAPEDMPADPERAAAARAPRSAAGAVADELPDGVLPCTDLANAHRLAAAHGRDLRHSKALGWYAWDSRRWAADDGGAVERFAHDVAIRLGAGACTRLGDAASKGERQSALALYNWATKSQGRSRLEAVLAVASALEQISVRADAFDRDENALNLQNGTLDLLTFELRPHRREDMLTRMVPVEYQPHAEAPTWRAFLSRAFAGDADLISFTQRAIGYSLTGSTAEQVFFLLHGTGANGKSTLLEVLRSLLGDYAAHTPTDTLMVSKHGRGTENDLARLRGARLVTAIESGEGRRLDEERVKHMTGGDTVTARFLFREHFEFKPSFKLWLACNNRPAIRGQDHAMWRRVRLLPFEVTIPEQERDPELVAKLRAEAPGILRWAVEGCRAWRAGGLQAPAKVLAATESYRAEQDTVGAFLAEECAINERASVKSGLLYERFVAWCKAQGDEPGNANAFGRRLTADGRFTQERSKSHGRLWRGLGLVARQESKDDAF